jgi:hypothetical protein
LSPQPIGPPGPYLSGSTRSKGHSFVVEARIWLNRVSMTGLLFAVDAPVQVTDPLDRHHSFLTWAPHWAHFANPGTGGKWWHRLSRPTLHRTAVSARCLTVRQRAARLGSNRIDLNVTYSDTLGFRWLDLPANRHTVCDYCFFGGPTRAQPLRPHERGPEDRRSKDPGDEPRGETETIPPSGSELQNPAQESGRSAVAFTIWKILIGRLTPLSEISSTGVAST